MANLVSQALEGTTLFIKVADLPEFSVDLSGAAEGPPNPLASALKPRFTLTRGNVTLLRTEPYGSPETGFPLGLVAVLGAAVITLIYFAARK